MWPSYHGPWPFQHNIFGLVWWDDEIQLQESSDSILLSIVCMLQLFLFIDPRWDIHRQMTSDPLSLERMTELPEYPCSHPFKSRSQNRMSEVNSGSITLAMACKFCLLPIVITLSILIPFCLSPHSPLPFICLLSSHT